MSDKVAIITFVEHQNPVDRGRMAHVLNLASELKAAGTEFELVFAGKSVEWLPQLLNEDRESQHPFVRNYADHFDAVREHVVACNFCCKRFDTHAEVGAAGIPIRGAGNKHMPLAGYVTEGWRVITI
jgi:hypothetical protein